MNRIDLQAIAMLRLDEAQHLLAASLYSGAYYLAGYVVECALKSCIAKSTQAHDFPDRRRVENSYSHDLAQLLRTASLEPALKQQRQIIPGLGQRWDTAQEWNESSRDAVWQKEDAESMLDAVADPKEGILPWLVQHW